MSNEALGKKPRGEDLEVLRLWRGISPFDSVEHARLQAQRHPWHGQAFIGKLRIPEGMFQLEATRSKGHYTLCGEPRDSLGCVRRVEPVENREQEVREMTYAPWDIETNNLVAEYTDKRDALALVLQGIERNGPHDTDPLSLDVEDNLGRLTTIAHGADLAALAFNTFSPNRRTG